MRLNARVNLVSSTGRHLRAVSVSIAVAMIDAGQARREDQRTIVITSMPTSTAEMLSGAIPRIHHGVRRAPDSQAGNSGRTWGYGGDKLSARIFGH
jgi:hypothetical protein